VLLRRNDWERRGAKCLEDAGRQDAGRDGNEVRPAVGPVESLAQLQRQVDPCSTHEPVNNENETNANAKTTLNKRNETKRNDKQITLVEILAEDDVDHVLQHARIEQVEVGVHLLQHGANHIGVGR
jgi:hypothetical protein